MVPPDAQAKQRGAVRTVDVAAFPSTYHREFVAGPASGLQSSYLAVTRIPPGKSDSGLHTEPSDKIYFVLKGQLSVQLGSDTFATDADSMVVVPAGVRHRVWNAGGAEEIHVEVMAPASASGAMTSSAQPRKIENAAALIRRPTPEGYVHPRPGGPGGAYAQKMADQGFGAQWLQARDFHGDFYFAMSEVHSKPGASSPPWHFHPFDQIYFVTDGAMTVELGTKTYQVKPYSFVIIPAGTVHRNWNSGTVLEKHLNFIVPEPAKGEAWDIGVELKGDITKQDK